MPESPSPSVLRLGTRASKLARAQAMAVQETLKTRCGSRSELVTVKTSGDRIHDRPLAEVGGKGLFTKELEEALLLRRIDLAVHSMKDLPTCLPAGLAIVATLAREDPSDVFISNQARRLDDLPCGSRIGTSSVRRAAQVARQRPDLEIMPLRGNVDTRLARLDCGEIDAIILALAGLKRLGVEARATAILPTDSWLPALAQGAIGIEMRDHDLRAGLIVSALDDPATAIALACERAFQAALDGSCRTPIAGLATVTANHLLFRGEVLAPDGTSSATSCIEAELGDDPRAKAAELGHDAGMSIKERARLWLTL